MAAKYLVRVRSFTQPTRVFDRGGWRNSVRWTPWKTVGRFDTYDEAAYEAGSVRYRTGLQRAVVFYRGKAYWRFVASDGTLVRKFFGSDALTKWNA